MKRWFRVRTHIGGGVKPIYLAAENTREVYRRLEREGIPRKAILSTTAYADVIEGVTPQVVARKGVR